MNRNPISLNEFENEAADHIRKLLEEQGINCRIRTIDGQPPGCACRVLMISDAGRKISAGIDLSKGYRNYLAGQTAEEFSRHAVKEFCELMENTVCENLHDYGFVRDCLFLRVSSLKAKEKNLSGMPHRIEAGMVLTCHILISADDGNIKSTAVTHVLRSIYGINEDQLFEDTIRSSAKLFPASIHRMSSFLFGEDETDEESSECSPLIVTNSTAVNGASALFYPGIMEKAAEMCGGSYYVIPSSIHEMLIVRGADCQPAKLESILHECNERVVKADERLSEHVCFYDCKTGTLRTCDNLIA